MVTRITRHEFRTDNATELMAPIIKSAKDALDIWRRRRTTATTPSACPSPSRSGGA
ncbi:hypothetical protein ABZ733_20925 [Streptomyces longwoodensis]|uniref:hypothetical protein n=1 Tax=Streptomyces longwoodensis TaxID=68231 RepID=UPI0033E66290